MPAAKTPTSWSGNASRRVRYFTLDYRRHEMHPELIDGGPRTIDAESERVAKLHLRDALRDGGNGTLDKSDFPST